MNTQEFNQKEVDWRAMIDNSSDNYDWTPIVNNIQPKGYCEFQNHADQMVYHGMISSITMDDPFPDYVTIRFQWLAEASMAGPGLKWKKTMSFDKLSMPNIWCPVYIESTTRGPRIRFASYNFIYIEETESTVGPDTVMDFYSDEQPKDDFYNWKLA
jgi:hypothetical protein